MAAPQSKQKRRGLARWWVYPRFQLSILGVNLGVMLGGLLGVVLLTARTYRQLHTMGVEAGLPPKHAYFEFLEFQQSLMSRNLWVGGGFLCAVSTVFLLLYTHRIAGPIVRLRAFLVDYVEHGRAAVKRLQFRKGDFLEDLPPQVNKALGLDEKKGLKRGKKAA
jgi:hypothetical protein